MELREITRQELDTELRETAFQHWVMTCNRDSKLVSLKMDIPARTIDAWAKEDGWAIRAKSFLAGIDEDQRAKILANITFGADEGVQYLRDVASGKVKPNRDRIAASRELDQGNPGDER